MKNFFGAVLQQCWFISHDRGLDAFLTLQQAVWSSFATENPLTNKMVTGYTEFALRKMRIIKAVCFIIRSPVLVFEAGQKSNSRAEPKAI